MSPRLLLDTHVLVHWVANSSRLTREQWRLMREATRRSEPLAISDVSLVELALLRVSFKREPPGIEEALEMIESSETIHVMPVSVAIAREVTPLIGLLRDPSDCVIVATARVHGLRLLTSDQRILDSNLAQVVG